MVLQNFSLLITLRLDVSHVRWSDLQNIKSLVHLEKLHLCEQTGYWSVPQGWAFAKDKQIISQSSPFHYLSKLRSLQLDLFGCIGANKPWDHAPLLQPISCMTNLCDLTLLMQSSYCIWDIEHLSQLSHLTSLGIYSLEQGISTLVKLEHLSVRATEPPARHYMDTTLPTLDLSTSLAMLTRLRSLDCGLLLCRQVLNLTALTTLTALTVFVNNSACHAAHEMFWSSFAKLPSLISLEVDAVLSQVIDFQSIALMTKLHFSGYSNDLWFSAADLNRMSALISLQHLHLEFEHTGCCSKTVQELDIGLKQLYNTRKMQHFQVVCKLFLLGVAEG